MYTVVYTVAIVAAMPESREHGHGALYWVESRKMWHAVLAVGFDDVTGKRLQKARMSKSKDEAVQKLNAMIRERDSLGTVLDRSTQVAELADRWLADVANRAKPKTLTNYRSNVRTKVIPLLGHRLVSELTPADVRRMHAAIRARGAGYSSVASAHRALVTMLEYAKSERVISGDNVAMLAPPRGSRVGKAKESFTRAQGESTAGRRGCPRLARYSDRAALGGGARAALGRGHRPRPGRRRTVLVAHRSILPARL